MLEWESDTIRMKIKMAEDGFDEWSELKKKYVLNGRFGIFFDRMAVPEYRMEFAEWLPRFIQTKCLAKAVIFSDKFELADFDAAVSETLIILPFSENIFQFYKTSKFERFIYVLSMEDPFGNSNMLGHKGITFKDWLRNWEIA